MRASAANTIAVTMATFASVERCEEGEIIESSVMDFGGIVVVDVVAGNCDDGVVDVVLTDTKGVVDDNDDEL